MEQILSGQGIQYNQRSLTEIQEYSCSLQLKIYSSLIVSKSQVILLHDKFQLKKQLEVKEASAIYINRQTSQTKLVQIPTGSLDKQKWNNIDQEGFTLLVQIYPKVVKSHCKSFNIARSISEPINNEKDLVSNTFVVLKSFGSSKLRKMKLRDRDIIKLGREIFEVILDKDGHNPKLYDKVYHQKQILSGLCRICLCQEPSQSQDYLISPCSCSGSCAYIHIECLRKWISNRVVKRQRQNIKTYNLKKLNCEICKSDFPKYISIDGNMIQLFPLYIQKDSLILQKLDFGGKEKIIHCIDINKNEHRPIYIGRNQTNELILDDMSISRTHAKLIISKEGIHLHDCNSKFGTFVMLKNQLANLKGVTLMSNRWTFQLNTTSDSL